MQVHGNFLHCQEKIITNTNGIESSHNSGYYLCGASLLKHQMCNYHAFQNEEWRTSARVFLCHLIGTSLSSWQEKSARSPDERA
jgi:hypothetical protein